MPWKGICLYGNAVMPGRQKSCDVKFSWKTTVLTVPNRISIYPNIKSIIYSIKLQPDPVKIQTHFTRFTCMAFKLNWNSACQIPNIPSSHDWSNSSYHLAMINRLHILYLLWRSLNISVGIHTRYNTLQMKIGRLIWETNQAESESNAFLDMTSQFLVMINIELKSVSAKFVWIWRWLYLFPCQSWGSSKDLL